MKILLHLISLSLLSANCLAQHPQIEWTKTYGGSFYDKAVSVVETHDGGYFIGGHSQSDNFDLANHYGFFDGWVIKLDRHGELQWKTSLGGSGEDYINSVIETFDNKFIVVGHSNSLNYDITENYGHNDYWIVKFTEDGTIEWKKSIGGESNEYAFSICKADNDTYLIAGYSESNDTLVVGNSGLFDAWLIKIDGAGNMLWQKSHGGSKNDHAHQVIKTRDNGFIFVGYSSSEDLPGLTNKGGLDFWVVKLNKDGIIQWQNTFGGTLDEYAKSVIQCSDGSYVIAGETYSHDYDAIENHSNYDNPNNRDYLIVKIDSLGQKIWSRCYGGVKNEYARSVLQMVDGEYLVVGESYSANGEGDPVDNHGSADFWVIKLNPVNGDMRWHKTYGGSGHDEPNCMVSTFDNGYLIVGNTASPANGDVPGWHGDDDFWILKLSNNECQSEMTLTKDIPSGNYNYSASEAIHYNGQVLNQNSIIKMQAGKSIMLMNGFQTHTGATFEAKMGNCN
ncbi:3-coathanger stack domain-containing protein [Emticicia agri]|uniref:T9SS C-terminal target domain-containing protein n=1 Tax=Emticicia agri TaxID=2492393 RepID=A0A4V1ZDI1_9BACT|nr:3-coathanger stack domain-containing protein [Emticicia agri]RYU96240.1 hypothetical protein EWM59_08505 [Emticicia agri]